MDTASEGTPPPLAGAVVAPGEVGGPTLRGQGRPHTNLPMETVCIWKALHLGLDAPGGGEDTDRLGLSDRWAACPTPAPRAAGPSPPPVRSAAGTALDLGRNAPRPRRGWSWEPAVESSCRESWPWSSFNYDRNVSLCLFGLGWAKSPFLAGLQSQPSLCQADGLGGSGICLVGVAFCAAGEQA